MLTLNKVMLLGTLPENPQLTYSENRPPLCSLPPLIEEKGQEHTLWKVHEARGFGEHTSAIGPRVSCQTPKWINRLAYQHIDGSHDPVWIVAVIGALG
jgi:hypothetical protein